MLRGRGRYPKWLPQDRRGLLHLNGPKEKKLLAGQWFGDNLVYSSFLSTDFAFPRYIYRNAYVGTIGSEYHQLGDRAAESSVKVSANKDRSVLQVRRLECKENRSS